MKTGVPTKAESSAPNRCNSKPQPNFTSRQMRCLDRLWLGPVMRYDLNGIIGTTNAPQTVFQLRAKGVSIQCEDVQQFDRDGRKCYPGRYSLTTKGRETLLAWGWA